MALRVMRGQSFDANAAALSAALVSPAGPTGAAGAAGALGTAGVGAGATVAGSVPPQLVTDTINPRQTTVGFMA